MTRGAARFFQIIKNYLWRFADVYVLQSTLARRLKVTTRTVRRWVKELRDAGFLGVKKRGPTSALYSVISEPPADPNVRSFVRSNVRSFAQSSYIRTSQINSSARAERKPAQKETNWDIAMRMVMDGYYPGRIPA